MIGVYRQTLMLTCTPHELHFGHVHDAIPPQDSFRPVSGCVYSPDGGV